MIKLNRIRWFRVTYFLFIIALIIATISSIFYVRGLLKKYEASQPEKQVAIAVSNLSNEAQNTTSFWKKYELDDVDSDIKAKYTKLFEKEDLVYMAQSSSAEDEACYQVKADGMPIAEVVLKAQGPIVNKLIVFSMRDWQIKSYKPLLEKREYVLTVPEQFTVKADGKKLSAEDAEKADGKKLKYTIKDVYLQPVFKITDPSGINVGYTVQGTRVVPEIHEYSINLPSTITVKVNGKVNKGTETADGKIKHNIMELEKPEIVINDLYGNKVNYDGGALPLTYHIIDAPEDYTVELNGEKLPKKAISKSVPRKYDILEGLVKNLPVQSRFEVAVLAEDAKITVKDENGKVVSLKSGETEHDFTENKKTVDSVPKNISDKVDVLKVAQNWSLYMSNDYSFAKIEGQLLPESNQYKVAKAYSTSIDRQFVSNHTLANPAFTGNTVKNFCQITDDSFSVEISFVKHMLLGRNGKTVDDAMNDRFYFVRKGDEWLLAGLKEVETNEK